MNPVTEMSNSITKNIDTSSARGEFTNTSLSVEVKSFTHSVVDFLCDLVRVEATPVDDFESTRAPVFMRVQKKGETIAGASFKSKRQFGQRLDTDGHILCLQQKNYASESLHCEWTRHLDLIMFSFACTDFALTSYVSVHELDSLRVPPLVTSGTTTTQKFLDFVILAGLLNFKGLYEAPWYNPKMFGLCHFWWTFQNSGFPHCPHPLVPQHGTWTLIWTNTIQAWTNDFHHFPSDSELKSQLAFSFTHRIWHTSFVHILKWGSDTQSETSFEERETHTHTHTHTHTQTETPFWVWLVVYSLGIL